MNGRIEFLAKAPSYQWIGEKVKSKKHRRLVEKFQANMGQRN